MNTYSYILHVWIDDRLELVASFSTPRKAYQFIDKHIKKLRPEELRSIDKGRGKDPNNVIYSYVGLSLEIELFKSSHNPDTTA